MSKDENFSPAAGIDAAKGVTIIGETNLAALVSARGLRDDALLQLKVRFGKGRYELSATSDQGAG